MTQQHLTDDQIRRAFERRADVNLPGDLRRLVITSIAAEPQRRPWGARAGEVLSLADRHRAISVLIALALLVAAGAALVLSGVGNHSQSRAGHELAFISGGDLWVADVDGAHPRLVWATPGSITASRPTWVDKDTILAQDIPGGVYAVDLRTSTSRLLATDGALLAVSPDLRRVAIGLDRPDGPHLSIVEIANGLQLADTIVKPAYVLPATPQIGAQVGLTGGPHAWSPDGRWLLGQGFDTDVSQTSGWIYQLDVQTGEIRDLATDLCCGLHKPNPVLAPDGSRVVYMDFHQAAQGARCDFRCGTLWSLDPVTLARQRLTEEGGSEVGPVFSPDGSWIAFAEYVGPSYDVAIVRADGAGRQKLTNIGDVYAPVANIEPYVYLAWDADGGGLTFMRGPGGQTEWQLWHVTTGGLQLQRLGTITATEFAR